MNPQIKLYDTTLRDGMQGEGMSLSAAEKLEVARCLDRLGFHFIEAGFPSSNPKEAELFELLANQPLETAEICAFGMTRRRDVAAGDDPALKLLADCFAPVCTLVGKTWKLHLEKVIHADPRGEPEDHRRLGGVPERAGKASDLRRRALLRRLQGRPGLRRALSRSRAEVGCRERHALRHERFQPAVGGGDRHCARRPRVRGGTGGHPHPQRRRLRRRQLDRRGTGGRRARPGHDQRRRGAVRQRQHRLDTARSPAQARATVRLGRAARIAERGRALRRRGLQPDAGPEPTVRRPQRIRPRGRHARRRRAGRRPYLRAHRSGCRRQQPPAAGVELSGKGTVLARAEEAGLPLDGERRFARSSA